MEINELLGNRELAHCPYIDHNYSPLDFCQLEDYLTTSSTKLIVPAKTIFTSVCYALFFNALTKTKVIDILQLDNLLVDDSYYRTYKPNYKIDYIKFEEEDKYQNSLRFLLLKDVSEFQRPNCTCVDATLNYFCSEFCLDINNTYEEFMKLKGVVKDL